MLKMLGSFMVNLMVNLMANLMALANLMAMANLMENLLANLLENLKRALKSFKQMVALGRNVLLVFFLDSLVQWLEGTLARNLVLALVLPLASPPRRLL